MTDPKILLAAVADAIDAERTEADAALAQAVAGMTAAQAKAGDLAALVADLRAQIEALKPDPWAKVDKTGKTDVTDAVQAILDKAGEITVPAGDYLIDAVKSLKPRSNTKFTLHKDARLIAKPNSADGSNVLLVDRVDNVTIGAADRVVGVNTYA